MTTFDTPEKQKRRPYNRHRWSYTHDGQVVDGIHMFRHCALCGLQAGVTIRCSKRPPYYEVRMPTYRINGKWVEQYSLARLPPCC